VITKEALHELIDALPDALLPEAARRLAELRDDPVLLALLMAPEDDEPETDEERAAVEEAREARAQGRVVADADLDRELGW
jgi:hypothetical protein